MTVFYPMALTQKLEMCITNKKNSNAMSFIKNIVIFVTCTKKKKKNIQ